MGFFGDEHDVQCEGICIGQLVGHKSSLLVTVAPDEQAVVVAEVVEERQVIEEEIGVAIGPPDVLLLVAVHDGKQKLCGQRK